MPYKVSSDCGCPEDKPFGIVKKDDGKKVGGCHEDKAGAMKQMQAMMASEHSMKMESGMNNPVILGIAATNRPHVRLREHPMSVVEKNGKKMVRVPFMVKGKYRHTLGPLDFTDEVFDKMIENHKNKVGDFGEGLDVKHIPDLGSLAWFDPDSGGQIVREDNLLVGYGVPTGEDALKFIEDGKFKWASVEFHPDYKSTLEKKYLESTTIDSVDLMEGSIQLANPYRDAFGRWASKGGGAVKKVGAAYKKNYEKGQREAADLAKKHGDSKKEFKATVDRVKRVGSKLRSLKGKADKWVEKNPKKALAGAIVAGAVAGRVGMRMANKKLEFEDLQPTLVREALTSYVSNGGQDEFLWFDKDVFNWDEMNLPVEDGHYKVDKQTAEEMLSALNELATEQPDVFYTEEDMQTLEEALARIEELEEELAKYDTPEPTEREKQLEAKLVQLAKQTTEQTIRLEVETARNYRDAEGRGHSAFTLNYFADLMMGKPLAEDTIKLESEEDAGSVADYFRKGIANYLKVAPGTQPAETKTKVEETRTLEAANNLLEKAKADAKDFWGNPVVA